MYRKSVDALTNDTCYEGFGIELIHELSLLLGFNYTFKLQEDSVYGMYNNKTKEWNGMIKELMEEVMFALDFVCVCRAVKGVHCTV